MIHKKYIKKERINPQNPSKNHQIHQTLQVKKNKNRIKKKKKIQNKEIIIS